jgi:hypothetical protein
MTKTIALILTLAVASATAQNGKPPVAPAHSAGKLDKRRDVVTRYIAAQKNVTDFLSKITSDHALPLHRSNLQVAMIKLLQVRNELKADTLENSPEVQVLLQEKGTAMAESSAKLAAQVTRVRNIATVKKELESVLSQL